MNDAVAQLVAAGKILAAQAPVLEQLAPGCCCWHETFGAGRVVEWDLLGERIFIDFEGKPRHAMGLRMIFKALRPLAPDHVLAQYLVDPAAVGELAADDPVAFVGNVLRGAGGRMGFADFERVVKGRIIPEAEYKKWWDRAKKALKGHREFLVPSRRTEPLQLRETGLSPADQLVEDFDLARNLGDKADLLDEMRRNLGFFASPATDLSSVLANAAEVAMKSQRLNPAGAVDLLLARDALVAAIPGLAQPEGTATLADLVRVEVEHLAEGLRGLSSSAARKVAQVLPQAFGADWVATATGLLDRCGPKGFAEVAAVLAARSDGRETLDTWLRRGLSQRSLGADSLAWIGRERAGAAAPYFGLDAALAMMEAVERAFSASGATRGNRALDVLVDDRALIPDLLRDLPENDVRAFVKRLLATPAIDDLTRRSLLGRAIKTHAYLADMVGGASEPARQDEVVFVSAASLERKKAELEDVVRRQIPENTKQIAIARGYGDLSENFEFKSAKQNQAFLLARKRQIERQIASARLADFAAADTSSVALGTIVRVRHDDGGEGEVAVLGAWDGDPARHILSYLSEAGQGLLGRKPGDPVAVPCETGESLRPATILSIRAAGEQDAESSPPPHPGLPTPPRSTT